MKLTLVVLVALSALATVGFADEIKEQADADPRGHVEVSNTSGNVTVEGWDRDEIRITGNLAEGAERLDFIRDGKDTLIKVVLPDNANRVRSSNLDIRIPQLSELSVIGVSSDIEVEGVQGVLNLQTVSGEISATVFEADAEARTVSGDVEIRGHGNSALLTIMTVSGDAEITDVGGELEASAVSGDLTIEGDALTRVRLRTTNGDITIQGALADGGRLDGETVNGDVEVILADISNLSVNVETFNGDIDHCFDAEVERKSRYGPGRELRLSRGDGRRSVRVKTLNGDVEICNLGGER